jgi:hypothetical protein
MGIAIRPFEKFGTTVEYIEGLHRDLLFSRALPGIFGTESTNEMFSVSWEFQRGWNYTGTSLHGSGVSDLVPVPI